jgi:hypothetical protein
LHPSFQETHIGAQTERCFTLINSTPPSIGICNIFSDFSHFLLRFQQSCERQIVNTIPLPKSTNPNTILTEFGILPPRNAQMVVVRERERERDCIWVGAWRGFRVWVYFVMFLDCEERKKRAQFPRIFAKALMSYPSSVQQLPCARSNCFLNHKSSSSSTTTTWRRGRSTRRSLLLRFCVHPQFHFTHRQLLQ